MDFGDVDFSVSNAFIKSAFDGESFGYTNPRNPNFWHVKQSNAQ